MIRYWRRIFFKQWSMSIEAPKVGREDTHVLSQMNYALCTKTVITLPSQRDCSILIYGSLAH